MPTHRQRITDEARLTEGRTLKFRFKAEGIDRDGFVTRIQGTVVAYENVCRHLPLPLDYGDGRFFSPDGQHFICRNHGATYEPLTGQCIRGPCQGASLKRLSIEVADGFVWLKMEED